MKALIITDNHLGNVMPGYLDAQIECLKNIYEGGGYTHVIMMGDVFIRRSPKPTTLLKLMDLLDFYSTFSEVHILRGNHDSETKADDGITALTLFANSNVNIYEHVGMDTSLGWFFIPHYENENTIKKTLESVPENCLVFGHFGYADCPNILGRYHSLVTLDEFRNRTFLGHLHSNFRRKNVTVLGTQYTTSYVEAGKTNYYGVLEGEPYNWQYTQKKVPACGGPRHLVYAIEDLYDNLDEINDPDYFTLLRVWVDSLSKENQVGLQEDLYEHCKVKGIDIQFNPVFSEEELSEYVPSSDVFSITDEMIEDYVNKNTTSLSKEDLMQGLELLRHED